MLIEVIRPSSYCELDPQGQSSWSMSAAPAFALTRQSATARGLDPESLGDHVDRLYRAARAMSRSREEAEDLSAPQPETRLESAAVYEAIAALPAVFRDALIAVDVLGLSYVEASRALRVREATAPRACTGHGSASHPCSLRNRA